MHTVTRLQRRVWAELRHTCACCRDGKQVGPLRRATLAHRQHSAQHLRSPGASARTQPRPGPEGGQRGVAEEDPLHSDMEGFPGNAGLVRADADAAEMAGMV